MINNKNEFNEKKSKLIAILNAYANKRADYFKYDTPYSVIKELEKKSCTLEEKQKLLDELIDITNFYIARSEGSRQILNFLYDTIRDYKKRSNKRSKKEEKKVKSIKFLDKEEQNKDNFSKLFNRYSKLFNLEIADREILLNLEKNLKDRIKNNLDVCEIKEDDQVKKVLGILNTGFYGKTMGLIAKDLKSNEIYSLMSDELLRYRLISLGIVRELCKARKEVIKPNKKNECYNKEEYEKLLKNIYLVGEGVRQEYEKSFGITPIDELKENIKIKMMNKEEIMEKEDKLSKCFNHYFERLNSKEAKKEELLKCEERFNNRIKTILSECEIKEDAPTIKVLGNLNIGFYGKTQKLVIEELKDHNINISQKEKLSSLMSDELLRYRLTSLCIVIELCKAKKEFIKPKTNNGTYNKRAYDSLLQSVYLTGKRVKQKYEKECGITPMEELKDVYKRLMDNPQITFDEILNEDEEKLLKPIIDESTKGSKVRKRK